jgi:hypothetical protein
MASNADEMSAFAGEIQKLAQTGGFNPFALLAGETQFHSVFIAPFSPSLRKHIGQFLADGTGPLTEVAKSLQSQGASASEAQQQAREMFAAAQGMLIVVMDGDHGLSTIPQLNFGHLEDGYLEHAVRACGDKFTAAPALKTALLDLRAKALGKTGWPGLIAGPSAGSNVSSYWLGLAASLIEGVDEGVMSLAGAGMERLRDLAHWIGGAIHDLGKPLDEDEAVLCARCHLIAGEAEAAAARIDPLLNEDADADGLAEVILHLSDTAIRTNIPVPAAAWLETFIPRFETLFGTCYELRIARVKLLIAAAVSAEHLLPAVELLFAANRKSARQDLTREPIWRVVVDPGIVLDTTAAAALIGRSATFVSKRLEQGTIPFHRQSVADQPDQIRIPETALRAWFAVMLAHKLLD